MTKNIKDYLHLYLGAPHRYKFVDSDNWSVWIELLPHRLPRLDDASIDAIQLALRPLSDMTEEECITANSLSLDGALDGDSNIKHYYHRQAVFFEPKEFVFLLSIGIDLFGLIESGLAIDKSTLTQSTK